MHPFRFAIGSIAAFSTFFAASLRAADDPLDAFPADTGVLLRLAPPADLANKSNAFLKNAAPQFAHVSGMLPGALGSLIGNPLLAGVESGRPWFIAVFPKTDAPPAVVVAAPASDAAELKKAVGQGYSFAEHDRWVVYSLDADAVKKVQARISGEGKAIRETLTGSAGQVFATGDAAAFLNIPILRESYKDQIEEGKAQLARATESAAAADPTAKAGLEMNRRMLDAVLKLVDDMTGVATSLSIGEQALIEETVVAVAPGSPSASFLAKQSPSDLPLLGKLPRGGLAYYAMAGDLGDFIAASTQMSAAVGPQNEEFKSRLAELETFKFSEIAGLVEAGDLAGGVFRSISIAKVDAPEKYLPFARSLIQSMKHVESPGVRQDITVKPEAETIDGVKVDVVTVVLTPDPKADPTGTSKKFMEIMFGKDGMTQRMAVLDGLFLQVLGEPETAKSAIEAVKGRPVGDEAASKAATAARSELGGKANLLVLLDLPQSLATTLRFVIESGQLPIPIAPEVVQGVKLTPSYAGVSVVAGTNEARAKIAVPAEQVRGTVDLLMRVQQATSNRKAEPKQPALEEEGPPVILPP